MAEWFKSEFSDVEKIAELMEKIETPGPVIDEVLHGEGADVIKQRITPLIPRSGRTWRKKGSPAASAMPGAFQQDNGQMSVTIAARGKYGYLYFPDDGSNTRKHAGNQQFMRRGAELASEKVIDLCVGKLLENL